MKNKKDLDWIDFILGTKNFLPRQLTKKALCWVKNKGHALDIGGGALNDTRYLLENGLKVDVIDVEEIVLGISKEINNDNLSIYISPIEKYDLENNKYDLILANYVLPFIGTTSLSLVMDNIFKSLKNEGIFCGVFFGENDYYKNNPDMYFHTKQQVLEILGNYQILYFSEIEKECLNYAGKLEHYHSFEFILKKSDKRFRKGAAAIVVNKKDEILLVNLESFDEYSFTVAGGGQDIGETLLETIYRELKEELNIFDKDLELMEVSKDPIVFNFVEPKIKEGIEYVGSQKYYFGFRFVGNDKDILPNPGEVRQYKWIKYEDLDKYLLFGSQLSETVEKVKELFPHIKSYK